MDYPHDGVFTRIKPSPIHGLGVFAILDIKKGTPIFKGDEDTETVLVPCSEITSLPAPLQEMYEDFCPKINGNYECPKNFNQMPISWLLNDARGATEPNIECRENLIFYAIRDIRANEELLVRYDTYSE